MDDPGLGDDPEDRHPRVQRLGRVLEHHLDGAAHRVELARAHGEEVAALPERLAGVGLDQPQDRLCDRRLARARLADDGEHLALLQLEARRRSAPVRCRRSCWRSRPSGSARRPSPARSSRRGRGRRRSASGCRGAWRGGRSRLGVPASTTSPAFITTTRSATSATTPRSWVMSTSPDAHLVLQLLEQLQHLGLHGDVERGGRLVGDDDVGLHRERHGDHHPLALAAGELVRVLVASRRRARGCRRGASARGRAPRPRARVMPWTRITSRSCQPTV